jgi:hypothetical protein
MRRLALSLLVGLVSATSALAQQPLDMYPVGQARPRPQRPARPEPTNFGLEPGKMFRGGSVVTPTREALQFVQEAQQESGGPGKLHLTVIGPDADREPVLRDLQTNPALAPFRDSLMIQGYRPSDWAVDPSLGFQTQGRPTILIQQARGPGDEKGGRVLWRAMDYSMGPEGLAEALRKLDPSYRPQLDPGPGKESSECPLGFTRDHVVPLAVVTILIGYVLTGKRRV